MRAPLPELSENLEDYLETVLMLCQEHGHAHLNDIAHLRRVKKPSANCALRSLAQKGLVDYEKYQPIALTERGLKIATSILGRHRVLKEFFRRTVGLKPKEAEEVACKLEHVLCEEATLKLLAAFERVKRCDICPECGAQAPAGVSQNPDKTREKARRKKR